MENKSIALAVCIAAAASTNVAAEEFTGIAALNLGDINSRSFLDERFIGSIPILYISADEALQLKARLAPNDVFDDLGVEKFPLLKSLRFDIKVRNGKPYVSIHSSKPIDLPFLSFVIEVYGSEGSIYQDYTVLLDPRRNSVQKASEVVVVGNTIDKVTNKHPKQVRVKAGDTLSTIASSVKFDAISNKNMALALYIKNPHAFFGKNPNKLKKGVTLKVPTLVEANELIQAKALLEKSTKKISKQKLTVKDDAKAESNEMLSSKQGSSDGKSTRYKVKSGDSLSAIARKFASKSVSFSSMMAAIHKANPHAFTNNKVNLLKKGVTLNIPIDGSSESLSTVDNAEKRDVYTVKKGDNLHSIVTSLGYKGKEAKQVMKSVFESNPKAFEKNNITIIKTGATLRLPTEIKIQDLAFDQSKQSAESKLETAINLSLNSLEKRLREIRKELKLTKSELFDLNLTLKNKDMLIERQSKDIRILKKKLAKLKSAEQPTTTVEAVTSLANPTEQDQLKHDSSENKTSVSEIVTYSGIALLLGLVLLRVGRQKYAESIVASDDYVPTAKLDPQISTEKLDFTNTLTEEAKANDSKITDLSIQEAERLVEELVDELDYKTSAIHNDNLPTDTGTQKEEKVDSSLDSWVMESSPEVEKVDEETASNLKADIISSLEKTMERRVESNREVKEPEPRKQEGGLETLEIDLERHLQSINDQIVANKMKDLI